MPGTGGIWTRTLRDGQRISQPGKPFVAEKMLLAVGAGKFEIIIVFRSLPFAILSEVRVGGNDGAVTLCLSRVPKGILGKCYNNTCGPLGIFRSGLPGSVEEMANFGIYLRRTAHGTSDFGAKQFAKLFPHPLDRHSDGALALV